jgi:hypothetical protein
LAPTEHFNGLSEEAKKNVLSGGLEINLLHSGLSFAVPLWWLFESQHKDLQLRNGSAFLADFGQGIFAITAAHVFTEYLEAKKEVGQSGASSAMRLVGPALQ